MGDFRPNDRLKWMRQFFRTKENNGTTAAAGVNAVSRIRQRHPRTLLED